MYQEVFKLHAELLKALSHPKRLEIIQLLRHKRLCVGDIQKMLDLPQANLSQHLQILRDAGVVKTKRSGKKIFYEIAHKNFIKASDLMREILIERNSDSSLASEFTKKMTDLVPLTHDPVCGMRLSPKTASFAYKKDKKEYFFCASGCYKKFKKNPKIYV